uniref:Uncharacterized protein n=1 Tax=Glossina palpalis gambiensis TaxID=67801 RepID=A0A1B0BAJ2_9MUSC
MEVPYSAEAKAWKRNEQFIHHNKRCCCCGWGGKALKVGWQLSDGLSAPNLPASALAIAIVVVVDEQNDDGTDDRNAKFEELWPFMTLFYDFTNHKYSLWWLHKSFIHDSNNFDKTEYQ